MPRAKRSLGQNFLVDPNIQRRIVEAVDPRPDDVIVEIGPGTGALTDRLVGNCRRLVAIELDDRLARELADRFAGRDDFEIINGNALSIDFRSLDVDPTCLKVVGNIPYNITSPLLFRLLEPDRRPARIVVMVQREVADRIAAPPGSRLYGALSVGVRSVAAVERLLEVGRQAFRPVPRVDSTVLRLLPRSPPPLSPDEELDLRHLTRTAFSWRRKQLQKILRAAPRYALGADTLSEVEQASRIQLDRRPETLSPDEFIHLCRILRSLPPRHAREDRRDHQNAPATHHHGGDRSHAHRDSRQNSPAPAASPFFNVLAHELCSPIASILGYEELITEGLLGSVDERVRGALRRIRQSAEQLQLLIDGIAVLANDDHPLAGTALDPVALATLLGDALHAVGREAADRKLDFALDLPPLPPVHADAERLRKILDLMLGAVVRAAAEGTLTVTLRPEPDAVTLDIDGELPGFEGVAPLEVEGGDPFRGIASAASLRLAMASRMVQGLSGTLRVRAPANGQIASRLSLRLPLAPPPRRDARPDDPGMERDAASAVP